MPEERRPPRRGGGASWRTHAVSSAVADLVTAERERLGRSLLVLDLGGGTGGLAVPLAELGHEVTVIDPSPDALAALERRAADAGVADRVTARQGDADILSDVCPGGGYDLVCCHAVLEVVDDPEATLSAVASVLTPGGHLSVTVAGRLAVVLARVLTGDFAQATAALTSEDGRWGAADPLPRRFDPARLSALLDAAGFSVEHLQGIRVFGDLAPSGSTDTTADREAFLTLERAVATHPDHAGALGGLGAHLHALARRR